MYFYWDVLNVGDLYLIIDDNLVNGVSKHLDYPVNHINSLSEITKASSDGYYCVYDDSRLNVYKKEQSLGYIYNTYTLTHVGIAGSAKSKNIDLDKNQWLFVSELQDILNKDTTYQLKPSDVKNK